MTNEFPFLENVRQALKVPEGTVRTKSMYPNLFTKNDTEDTLDTIRTRSYIYIPVSGRIILPYNIDSTIRALCEN